MLPPWWSAIKVAHYQPPSPVKIFVRSS